MQKAYAIGHTCFLHRGRVADPKDWSASKSFPLLLPLKPGSQREREAAQGPGIAGKAGTDLRNAIHGQPSLESSIEFRNAEGQAKFITLRSSFRLPCKHTLLCRRQSRHRPAFQSGNLFTQGKKLLLRRGISGHGVSSVHKCSLYVLMDSRARPESQQTISTKPALPGKADDSTLEKLCRNAYMALLKGANMARIDQTDDWRDRHAPTISAFESLAIEAYGHLPEEFRALTTNLIIEIEDFPDDDVFEDMALETPFDLLGLFEGRGISERFTMETGELPNRIRLYRRPILDYWAENEETLGDIITHVLIHEIGHHFGLSDDDMERIEASAEQAADR